MNCLRKKREEEIQAADATSRTEREELEDLTILLEGRDVAEDYVS